MSTTSGNIGWAAVFLDKQKYPNTIVCSAHWGAVGAPVLGMLELTVIGVMIANFFPLKCSYFGEIYFFLQCLCGTVESITKKCLA